MVALPAEVSAGELVAGTGRVTLFRTGSGSGFGAYAMLYTTRSVPGGGVEAIIAATLPEDTDLLWGVRSRISTERDSLISAGQAWFRSG
jgi:hypothetical protein